MAKKPTVLKGEKLSFVVLKPDGTPMRIYLKKYGLVITMASADGDNIVWGT